MWTSMLVVASLLVGQGPAAQHTELARTVAVLIRQLDDDRVDTRQAAEAALIELGPDILEVLPAADTPTTAEVRERLARIRGQLQIQQARRSLDASRVSLDGEMSLAEALRAIQQQTGNALVGYEDFDQRVTVQFQQTPFWEAVDQLLDQAQLRIDPFAGAGRGLKVVRGPMSRAARAACAGLFRFEPTMVTAVRDLRDPSLATMRVRLLITWEPRTMPILLSQRLSDIVAVDDVGRPVEISGRQGTLTASVESDLPCVELELPFVLPDRGVLRLASLRGTLEAMLPSRIERFEFDDLEHAVNVQQRRAGVTVTFEQTRKNDDTQEMHVRISFAEPANSLESHRGWIYKNNAYLIDADGNRLASGGQRVVSQEPDTVGMAYLFALTRPVSNYHFVYETPSLIIRHSVAYELKDIDLP
jgi:hypothetical protein